MGCCSNLEGLRPDTDWTEGWAALLEYYLGLTSGRKTKRTIRRSRSGVKDEGCQTTPQPKARSTSDLQKQPRELSVSPQETAARKPKEKSLRASSKEEEWVDVLTRKNLRKQKTKPGVKKLERPRRARPEAVLIKPAEGVSYAAILKDLIKHVKPDERTYVLI